MKKFNLLFVLILIICLLVGCSKPTNVEPTEFEQIDTNHLEKVYVERHEGYWAIGKFIEKDTGNIIYVMDGSYSGAMVVIEKSKQN